VIGALATQKSSGAVRRCACGGSVGPTGECDACRRKRLQRLGRGSAAPERAPAIVHDVLRTPGRPLEPGVRAEMEARLTHDFSQVRVHTDGRAAESARAVDALAYTVGSDVVFDAGRYAPGTDQGRRVLRHELAHVVQQTGTPQGSALSLDVDHSAELEAERVASGASVTPRQTTRGPVLQRLGANPGCTAAQASAIHQAIFNARGWLNKVTPQLAASPLPANVVASLRRNFGPTYGVAVNASLIAGRLRAGYGSLSTIPFSCADATDATCAAAPCGYAVAGSHAATICTNATLATTDAVYRAGCVLHESLHATFSRFTVDEYSGWHGHSGATATYPGTGTDPLLNADSYTSLVMDLS
jgi:hypothetical protein